MKIKVIGKAHREGVAKKTGNPYNFNQVHYTGPDRGVEGLAAQILRPALDNSTYYDIDFLTPYWRKIEYWAGSAQMPSPSSSYTSQMQKPTSYLSSGFEGESNYSKKYGWMSYTSASPTKFLEKLYWQYSPAHNSFAASRR